MTELSRQRKWQIKQTTNGKCHLCTKPLTVNSKTLCLSCLTKHGSRSKVKYRVRHDIPVDREIVYNIAKGAFSRHNPDLKFNQSLANRNCYRKKHGIPLNAPKYEYYKGGQTIKSLYLKKTENDNDDSNT